MEKIQNFLQRRVSAEPRYLLACLGLKVHEDCVRILERLCAVLEVFYGVYLERRRGWPLLENVCMVEIRSRI